LPFLVPQVDGDGNERAGIRLPEVSVPLATYTGWNFRNSRIGGTDQLVALLGSYVPFAQTKGERDARHDPRRSVEDRYPSRDAYMELINKAAAALVKDGYLLAEDVAPVTKRAADHWEYARETKN
jgi:Alpha/beta hydrolase domain